jgi:hypothetical protein
LNMELTNVASTDDLSRGHVLPTETYANYSQVNASAISWSAILAGATATAVLSLILLLLGAGLGLSSLSPWAHKGISGSTFGISTIVWLTVTQILAAGMGGYLTGRLRTKWDGLHADEVYFRDTAHGFLAWAVASLVTAALLTSVIGSIVNGGVQVAASLAGNAANATSTSGAMVTGSETGKIDNANGSEADSMGYIVDSLFRKESNLASPTSTEGIIISTDTAEKSAIISEVTRIFISSMSMKTIPPADLTYISQIVASHTGFNQQQAEKRVRDIYSKMQTTKHNAEVAVKVAADKARKATIYATLWLFVSLLMGAFSASLAATWGGCSRDA